MSKLEDILENLNGFGKYQKIRYVLLCFSGLLPPIASYIHSFIAANPGYICQNTDLNNNTNLSHLFYGQGYKNRCKILKFQNKSTYYFGSLDYTNNEHNLENCKNWFYDKTYYKKTLTEQFNLVCENAIWRSFMQAVYYTGMLIGSILLGLISKKFGQKISLIISLILLISGSLILSFVSNNLFENIFNYVIIISGRFIIAIGSHGISINSYLLTMEFIGRNKKKYCALMFEFIFALGQLVLVFSAYFLREWRDLTFVILVPCLPFFLLVCLSDESIQFLSSRKDFNRIEKLLKKIAKTNKTHFDDSLWKSFLSKENTDRKISTISQNSLIKPNYFVLFLISLNWIINNFIFHGLGLRSNDLGISPYDSFALSAFIELICSMFTFKLLQYKYRRKLYFCFMLISGVFCTMIFYSKNVTLTTTCAMIAKFSIACTYAIIRLYSSEYFPENLRKNYLTKCSIMARTGSVIAPFIIALGDYFIKPLPFLIFGFCCFISALTTLFLPRIQKENIRKQEVRIDLNQQLIQNNWLDGQDIELEKTDNNIDSSDEIEIKEIN